jgi:hypothetical protein
LVVLLSTAFLFVFKNLNEGKTMTAEKIYLSLKCSHTAKAGKHSKGQITYRILTDELHQNLFITIVGNEGGGWFSNEVVAIAKIEEVLSKLNTKVPLPTKAFAPAFESKSANNAGFLVAVLRAEGLLNAPEEGSRLHLVTQEWELWQSVMLTEPGEVYEPPVKTPANAKAEKSPSEAEPTVKPKLTLKVKPSKKAEKTATDESFDPLLTLDDADDADEAESELEAESLGEGSDENSDQNS